MQTIKTALKTANVPLLDQQLKAALPTVCKGIVADGNGLFVILDDTATQPNIDTALTVCAAHDPNQDTPEQTAVKTGKTNIAAFLNNADTALTQLAAKQAVFQAAPTLANAAPLLLEISQDVQGIIKALRFAANQLTN